MLRYVVPKAKVDGAIQLCGRLVSARLRKCVIFFLVTTLQLVAIP